MYQFEMDHGDSTTKLENGAEELTSSRHNSDYKTIEQNKFTRTKQLPTHANLQHPFFPDLEVQKILMVKAETSEYQTPYHRQAHW